MQHDKAESVVAARCSTKSQPLRLNFVMSPNNTVQRLIRFSDGKPSFVILFFGSILSIFDIQGNRVLLSLGGQIQAGGFRAPFIQVFLLFLMTMILSSLCALQTIAPDLGSLSSSLYDRRPSLCYDVLRYPVDEYLTLLRALSDGAALQERVHELYAALSIVGSRFGRISHCLRWAVTSFLAWIALILMTSTL